MALIAGSFFAGRHTSAKPVKEAVDREVKIVTEAWQKDGERLKKDIAVKEAALNLSEKRYANLKGLIQQKATEAENIKLPEDMSETKKRLSDIGFKPLR